MQIVDPNGRAIKSKNHDYNKGVQAERSRILGKMDEFKNHYTVMKTMSNVPQTRDDAAVMEATIDAMIVELAKVEE